MIRSIIFDWGGVLIENPSDGLASYCAHAIGLTPDVFKREFRKYEYRLLRGLIEEQEVWDSICREQKKDPPKSKSLWKEAVRSAFKDDCSMYALVKKLRKKGYLTGLITNTESAAMEYFLERGYDKHFDAVVFSCAEHAAKPEQIIYQRALERLGVKPVESIFIDDKPAFIEAARKTGMNGIVYKGIDNLVVELSKYSVNQR